VRGASGRLSRLRDKRIVFRWKQQGGVPDDDDGNEREQTSHQVLRSDLDSLAAATENLNVLHVFMALRLQPLQSRLGTGRH
jgi:hypothetical protein